MKSEKQKLREKKWREDNKDRIKAKMKKWYEDNKQEVLKKQKAYNSEPENKQRRLLNQKEYCANNKEHIKEKKKEYSKSMSRKNYIQKWTANKMATDPAFKFSAARHRTKEAFKTCKSTKQSKTEDILNCSIDEFREYIIKLFKPGMTLDNHGEWHLDHIIPLAYAKSIFIDEEKQKEMITKLCHFSNYQPLWASDNLSKGRRAI